MYGSLFGSFGHVKPAVKDIRRPGAAENQYVGGENVETKALPGPAVPLRRGLLLALLLLLPVFKGAGEPGE